MIHSSTRSAAYRLAPLIMLSGMASLAHGQETPAGSLTLRQAVTRALEYHPSLRAADAGVRAASATVGEATSEWWPKLSFEASATRFEEPMLTSPIHEFAVEAIPPFDRTLYGGSAMLGFNLFDGGARSARVGGARAEARGAGAASESTRHALISRVALTYLGVLSAQGVLEAHERQLVALAAERDRVQRRLAEGTAARVELLRADAAIAASQAERVVAAARLEVAQRDLARLTGASTEETGADRLVPVSLRDTSGYSGNRATFLALADSANPGLRQARERATSAESKRKAAVAAWLPSFELFGGYIGYGYPDGFTTEWQVGARVRYPIFTGFARSSAITRASALRDAAHEEVRLEELALQESLDRAVTVTDEIRARVIALSIAVEHLAEVTRIEQLALDAGASTQTDYLQAEAELLRARAILIEARHGEIAARIELARITGELSEAWLDRAVEIAR